MNKIDLLVADASVGRKVLRCPCSCSRVRRVASRAVKCVSGSYADIQVRARRYLFSVESSAFRFSPSLYVVTKVIVHASSSSPRYQARDVEADSTPCPSPSRSQNV